MDANVVAAALLRPEGWTARELRRDDVTWLAPAFLLDELEEHADEYVAKARCTRAEWDRRLAHLLGRVEIVPAKDVVAAARSPLARQAEKVDPDDVVYLATLVAAEADLLWTRDWKILDAFPGVAILAVPRA